MAPKYYKKDDEALIHASIQEIINIWKRRSGNAKLSLEIDNGSCELNISFSLGTTSCDHVAAYVNQTSNQQVSPPLKKNRRKRKSPSQRLRDQKRAEDFRLRKVQGESQSSIRLPFPGQILPLKKDVTIEDPNNPCDSLIMEEDTTPLVPTHPMDHIVPMKSSGSPAKLDIDVNSMRRESFPSTTPSTSHDVKAKSKEASVPPNFKLKEDELFSRLFS